MPIISIGTRHSSNNGHSAGKGVPHSERPAGGGSPDPQHDELRSEPVTSSIEKNQKAAMTAQQLPQSTPAISDDTELNRTKARNFENLSNVGSHKEQELKDCVALQRDTVPDSDINARTSVEQLQRRQSCPDMKKDVAKKAVLKRLKKSTSLLCHVNVPNKTGLSPLGDEEVLLDAVDR